MTREEFNEQSLIDRIENRINAEYHKHKAIDWAKIAAIKIAHEIMSLYGSSLPPAEDADPKKVQWSGYGELGNISQKPLHPTAEGAEENVIYHELIQPFRKVLQSVSLHGYDIIFAERDCVKIAEAFATLHAQKMTQENLREELIAYDKYASRWIDNYRAETAEDCVDEYLKSKEQ